MIALDQDLRVIKVSRSFYDFFKVKPEETIGQLIYDLGNKQWDIPGLRELLETILPQKTTFDDYEVEHDFTTIGRRIMLLNARQIQRGLGKESIILLAIEDITLRKWAEDANLRRMALFVKDSNDAITIADFEGRITAWNHGAELMYGYSEEEALQMSLWRVTPQDKIAEKKAFIDRLIVGEMISSFETQRVTKDGRILDVWLTVTKLVDETGKPIGIASTERDITARKRLENDLLQNIAQIKQKNRDLEQIISVTSHDLRSPLVNVQGFSKELARSLVELAEAIKADDISSETMRKIEPILKKDIPESIGFIQSSIIQMDMQLSALLKISRLGHSATNLEKLDMNGIVAGIVKSLEYTAKEKGTQIRVEELPPCMADTAHTNQIFINKQVKADDELKKMPVMMLTTTDDPREVEKCHLLGCNNYVTKPIDYDKFVDAIRQLGLFLLVVEVPKT